MVTVPAPGRLLLVLTVGYGLAFFLWLVEEDSIQYVTVLGIGAAVLAAAHTLGRRAGGRALGWRRWLATMAGYGALAGGGGALATALLMAVKVSIHGHPGELDYAPATVLAFLIAAPLWALIGAGVGLGTGLLVGAARTR